MRTYDPGRAGGVLARVTRAVRRLRAERALRSAPATPGEQGLEQLLADGHLSRADLSSKAPGNFKHHRRMIAMMRHFGIEETAARPVYWGALREAERLCATCGNEGRCHRWLAWGRANDAPRVFCPNAALYDDIALDARKSERQD